MHTQGNMVSWKDYEGIEGFGSTTQQDVDNLNKALTAGQDRDPPGAITAGDGFALRVESLESTLKNVTYRMEHVKFWRNVPKLPAYNTVEEYNRISSYGDNPDAGYIDEGDLPSEDDTTYSREFSIVKYLGTTRRVTHVMSLVKPAHGSVLAAEAVNGTMHLLRVIERGLFFARSDLSSLQFDGFEKLIEDGAPAANIIDLRGAPLSEDVLTDGALTISDAPNYGIPTDLYLNPRTKADLVKAFFPKERYDLFTKTSQGLVGLDIQGFTSPAGDVRFNADTFIDDGGGPNAAIVGDASKVPSAFTVSTGPTVAADGLSQFVTEDAGDYFYEIVAVNRYGRSAAQLLVAGPTAVTVGSGDKVTFGLTPGAIQPAWWEIFRTKVGGAAGTERLILRVPHTTAAAEETINDYNANLPNTTSAFMFQQNLENMSFKQLAPMVKVPLATIDTSIRFMLLLYGVPVLYSPGKNVLFKNIGRAAGAVGTP
ncbi:MAG: hypothetical protein JSU89_14150 [Myxococcales bacterium]|nr:MAG: hypothetical protein JSU89_14150 [Myxococcales bacterium]